MKKNKPILTYEFETFYIEGQPHKDGYVPLSETTFNNLWDFILSNRVNDEIDSIMSIYIRSGRRYIKTGRYVGTIQTKDGQIIEILPKIYKSDGEQETNIEQCRKVFLNMLKHFSDIKAKSFQDASLETKKGFPILEIYVSNYVSAVEEIVLHGIKKDYSLISENQRFLKGRLDLTRHISKNSVDKSRFAVKYNKYVDDIPQNRIIVSTLLKLYEESTSITNRARILTLLRFLNDIPQSSNIISDLNLCNHRNRLFESYDKVIIWSSQFLLNKGFTNFSGTHVNQSLLFPADRLFEQFIAYLFKKYVPRNFQTNSQNARYYLVDRHNGRGMFRLRPDIVVESNHDSHHYDCIIIDTKWKAIDSHSPKSNYLIDIKDMYQLYAYGQKYRQGESLRAGHNVIPKLILLYPSSEKFIQPLPEFVYEDILNKYGLKLMVVPFDLADTKSYKKQILNIIRSIQLAADLQPVLLEYDFESGGLPLVAAENLPEYSPKPKSDMMLVGCFRDNAHKDWVLANKLYNIRLGRRNGSLEKSGLMIAASRLLLYDKEHPENYRVFNLDTTKQILANKEIMEQKGYPGSKASRKYVLYVMGDEVKEHPKYDVISLREQFALNSTNNAPFFVEL